MAGKAYAGRGANAGVADQGGIQDGQGRAGASSRGATDGAPQGRQGARGVGSHLGVARHKLVEPKAAKTCLRKLEDQTKEREGLYGKAKPPGENIPCNADRAASNDETPSDEEMRWATKRGRNNKSSGDSGMRVEDLKDWLAGAEREAEKEKEGGGEGMRGGETCGAYSSAWSSTCGKWERSRASYCAQLLC